MVDCDDITCTTTINGGAAIALSTVANHVLQATENRILSTAETLLEAPIINAIATADINIESEDINLIATSTISSSAAVDFAVQSPLIQLDGDTVNIISDTIASITSTTNVSLTSPLINIGSSSGFGTVYVGVPSDIVFLGGLPVSFYFQQFAL
jgi:hypothetical protein